MKKFTLLLISVFAMQVLFSQPVLTNSLKFTIGDTYLADTYLDVTSIDLGSSGANQSWDFSTISGGTYVAGESVICVDPATTPCADSSALASANICTRSVNTPNTGFFHYFDCNNTSQNLIAMALVGSGGDGTFMSYSDDCKILEFPFTYGDSYDDTWEAMMYSFEMGYYYNRDSTIVTVEADAYGTITTPAGQFQNVLRIKTTSIDYSWTNYGGTEWIPMGSFTDIQYHWYAPNIKVAVMSISEAEWMPGFYRVQYLVEHNFSTGLEETVDCHFELFPNPASDRVSIKTDKPFTNVGIYSLLGEQLDVVASHSVKTNEQIIDLSAYPLGVYFIKLKLEDGGVITKKILKQ
ncbi:MAG: hypothetical protein B7C24_07040 [Bacteroidetes bacterium 4572_77]|nr:MAG: hypothetical protein B7C24_07040 [Bacteroidetes bacterium 4572_77]